MRLRGRLRAHAPHRARLPRADDPRGTPVYATGDATVEIALGNGYNGGYGHQVLLNHEFGYKTRYAHLSDVLVKPGERVKRGQLWNV